MHLLREGNGSPLQYSCLGNPMNRGAWWATIHGASRVVCDLATKHKSAYESAFKKPTIKEDVKGHSMALFPE